MFEIKVKYLILLLLFINIFRAAAKRASQLVYSGNNDLNAYNYAPQQIELSSNSYYSKNLGFINSNATSSGLFFYLFIFFNLKYFFS